MPTAAPAMATRAPIAPGSPDGRRGPLSAAFEALERLPAFRGSCRRVLEVCHCSPTLVNGVLIEVVGSDPMIALAVLRAANQRPQPEHGGIRGLTAAAEALTPAGVAAVVRHLPSVDLFERTVAWDVAPERFRLHALACQRVAGRLAMEVGWHDADELMTAALLQDVGGLALWRAYPETATRITRIAHTPGQRVLAERTALGVDHARVSGVLLRRWGLPRDLTSAVERHHADDADGEAALLRLTDEIVHHTRGIPIPPDGMIAAAGAVGISRLRLRSLLIELSRDDGNRHRQPEDCSLTEREREVLRRLADGSAYRQIGDTMGLTTSTVRTHLHNIYRKLGVHNRARAVLVAMSNGWLAD